uniref:serine/arginine repetitive matrix protein 3-like n=1 Tax=Halichoerus grypus TaxID=9711 RepID=UPI001659DBBD|nr:serine/arginine repetitive matrix protein 3-like [Halichoerus grypus]
MPVLTLAALQPCLTLELYLQGKGEASVSLSSAWSRKPYEDEQVSFESVRFKPCADWPVQNVLTTHFRNHIQDFHVEYHEVFSVWNYLLILTWKQVYLFSIKGKPSRSEKSGGAAAALRRPAERGPQLQGIPAQRRARPLPPPRRVKGRAHAVRPLRPARGRGRCYAARAPTAENNGARAAGERKPARDAAAAGTERGREFTFARVGARGGCNERRPGSTEGAGRPSRGDQGRAARGRIRAPRRGAEPASLASERSRGGRASGGPPEPRRMPHEELPSLQRPRYGSIVDDERLSAEEMDERRRQNIAYEYLCHLEEAKRSSIFLKLLPAEVSRGGTQ